jgi:hypothetical protein
LKKPFREKTLPRKNPSEKKPFREKTLPRKNPSEKKPFREKTLEIIGVQKSRFLNLKTFG